MPENVSPKAGGPSPLIHVLFCILGVIALGLSGLLPLYPVFPLLVAAALTVLFVRIPYPHDGISLFLILAVVLGTAVAFGMVKMQVADAQQPPVMGVGAIVGLCLSVAALVALRKPQEHASWGFLLLTGIILLIATRAWAANSLFQSGFIALLLWMGAVGGALGWSGTKTARAMLPLLPQVLMPLLYLLESHDRSSQWVINIWQPLLALGIYVAAYLICRGNRIQGGIFAIATVSLLCLYFIRIDRILFSDSWEKVDAPVATFSLIDMEGHPIPKSELNGQVLWIDLFATTCRPCVEELRHVSKLSSELGEDAGVRFLAVGSAQYEPLERIKSTNIFQFDGVTTAYEQEPNLGAAYAPQGVPVGLLVDKEGVVRWKKVGFMPTDTVFFKESLREKIEDLLEM